MDEKKPKKTSKPKRSSKPRSRKKKQTTTPEVSGEDIPPMPASLYSSLSALMSFDNPDPKVLAANKSLDHITSQMQEHFGCYILIGYTCEGRACAVTYAPTTKDMDSLNTSLQRYILEGHSGKFFPGNM